MTGNVTVRHPCPGGRHQPSGRSLEGGVPNGGQRVGASFGRCRRWIRRRGWGWAASLTPPGGER